MGWWCRNDFALVLDKRKGPFSKFLADILVVVEWAGMISAL
jgi:hypothetical protein